MTTCNNFNLKVKTGLARKVVKSILETWNVANVIICMFGLFILW